MILEIRTPTRRILKNMVNEGWITTKAFESERIPLELLMMFQHGIIPMIENEQDYEINLFKNISIKGQIRKRKIAIDMVGWTAFDDDFYRDEMIKVHKAQLSILEMLDRLMTSQFS